MATLLHSESRRLYSWWWDSHISPKNSKWLQENLTDMDVKVKAMIKLIEEDADSFARRAEMYYKKRPELMKLVEEFYRAYRALAERYDHATVELRQAHRTMEEAFPNQVPSYITGDDSPSDYSLQGSGPHTPEIPHPDRALYDPDDLHKDVLGLSSSNFSMEGLDAGKIKRGLKQLDEMFSGRRVKRDLNFHGAEESKQIEAVGKYEAEIQSLKEKLSKIEAEKEAVFLKYQQALENLSNLERELDHMRNEAGGLDARASKSEIEIKVLKEALLQMGAERDAGLIQYNQCLERISSLEISLTQARENSKGLDERALKAEIEAQNLKQQLSTVEAEKEASHLQVKKCLEKISVLETKISVAEENARMLNEQIKRAEDEAMALKKAFEKLNEEKEATSLKYLQCLEIIAQMESQISRAQDDAKRLRDELTIVVANLESKEERCSLLEESNQSLQFEAGNLVDEIKMKDQELQQKQDELKKLQILMQEEQSRFSQVETSLEALQNLHYQSQEEQKAFSVELKNGLQMLSDLDKHKHEMEEELQKVKDENRGLNEVNSSSTVYINNLENEILSLKEIKEKLEEEVVKRADQSNALGQEIHHLREEIKGLNGRYQAVIEQVEALGLNPERLGSSVKDLQDENAKLREEHEKEKDKREALYKKLNHMDKISKENAVLGISLAEMNGELQGLREKVNRFQESSEFLRGEKSSLVEEKATLISQLQIITENMKGLLERNTSLENSLRGAYVELEGLRVKSNSLEQFCELLKNEKSNLQDERSSLVSRLENVEFRLKNLETRFSKLEDKCLDLENERASALYQVEELRSFILVEKQEHVSCKQSTEARLVGLEKDVHVLEEESRLGKEFEEELDRAVNAQIEIFILQKFIKDLEERNFSLSIECQKHDEASKMSDKLIMELEAENLEQQVEVKLLVDEIEKLRAGIIHIFWALQFEKDNGHGGNLEKKIGQMQIPMVDIFDMIEDLKTSLVENEDDKHRFLFNNSVLLTVLKQLELEGSQFESEKNILEQDFKFEKKHLTLLEVDNCKLGERNEQLMLEASQREKHRQVLEAELEALNVKLIDLQGDYLALKEENSSIIQEKASLFKKCLDLEDVKHSLEEDNSVILQEAVALDIFSLVSESFMTEKAVQIKALVEDFQSLHLVNGRLKGEIGNLEEKVEVKEVENLCVKELVEELTRELHEVKVLNIELCNTVEELKMECEESFVIRECLKSENTNMKNEVNILHKEINEYRIREENLSSDLQERRDEFELWESEAATFYFDLQLSAINEVFLENKVYELTQVCENISEESVAKSMEIHRLKDRVNFMESEIGEIKAELSAYAPAVAALRNNVESLEQNVVPWTKDLWADNQDEKDGSWKEVKEDQGRVINNGVADLRKIEARIKVIEKEVLKDRDKLVKQETILDVEAVKKSTRNLKSGGTSYQERNLNKPENGILMKDILLDQASDFTPLSRRRSRRKSNGASDQMLELWKTSEKSRDFSSELQIEKELGIDRLELFSPSSRGHRQGDKKRKIIKRLASDAQKLLNIQSTTQELKKRLETTKNRNHRAGNNNEYETVKRQLEEVEDDVFHLVNMNGQMINDIEDTPFSSLDGTETSVEPRITVTEQARRWSEKIGRLQLEVEKIQHALVKMEDAKSWKGKNRFSKSSTGILLRDFIYTSRGRTERKKKGCFCGCSRPTTSD